MEQRLPITPSSIAFARLRGYVFQSESPQFGLSPSGNYDLKGFPQNADWNRFDLFFDGTLFRILVFKSKSQTTLYQGSFDSENSCFQYGFKVAPELSLVDTPEDANLADFVVIGNAGNLYLLLTEVGQPHRLYCFPFDLDRKAFRPGPEEQSCTVFELLKESTWPGWQSCKPTELMYKIWSLAQENIMVPSPENNTSNSPVTGSDCFSVISNGNSFRLYTIETNYSSQPTTESTPKESIPPTQSNVPPLLDSSGFPLATPKPQNTSFESQVKSKKTFESVSNFPNSPNISLDSEINIP